LREVQYLKIAFFIIWKYFGKWCEAKCLMCNDFSQEPVIIIFVFFWTNLIHPLARDVKDTLLTRKRQLAADSDSNSLLGVLLLVCHKAK
jgi:hypothetical protein